jgi:LPXTG-motif cell wall-anchored protein
MKLKHRLKSASGFALTATAALIGALALASPAQAQGTTIPINGGNVPTTAQDFDPHSCDKVPGDKGADEDGWVFVLPASAGAEGNFISVTATFEDLEGNEQVLNTAEHGGIVSGSGDNNAFIISPAGWTLLDAEAEVNLQEGKGKEPDFNLTRTCPGEPGEEPTTPAEEPTTPGEEPTTPGQEPTSPALSPTAPGERTTDAAGGLPTTGASTGLMIALGLVLAAGGAVLIMVLRRRARAQDY